MSAATPRRIAVVGSGVAGLTACHVLSRSAHVTLFEADHRLGGHADTHRVTDPATGRDLAIDTGFIVHNRRTYPVLQRLFAELDVPTQASEMSMSIADEASGLEWAGALGPRGLFPTAANLRNPRYLRMLGEIPRFHRRARRLLADESGSAATLQEFLDDGGFTTYFRRHFAEPLVAAVWSCDPSVATLYPAAYLFRFLDHHGMLGVFGSPAWRTVTGGSVSYVDRVATAFQRAGGTIRLGTAVRGIVEVGDGVRLRTDSDEQRFDAVVVATHPGQALAMLERPTPPQRDVLAAMPYSANTALLHTDVRLLPNAVRARASWNFRRAAERRSGVLVTYDLTRLQRLPTPTRYLVTLGGEDLVDPATVIARREYEHPRYTPTSVAAQAELPRIDTDRIVFAGAYHGWGFHEDGARSGLAAAERLGHRWELTPVSTTAAASAVPRTPEAEAPVRAYTTRVTHTRHAPWRRTFRHRSRMWVVDLDRLPAPGRRGWLRGRFTARDHFDGTAPSIRAALDAHLLARGLDLRGGRALMAAQPRALGHCFNPISVHWVWRDPKGIGTPDATVVEVHNTYGDRHAYLVPTDVAGRGEVAKAMYVSPFHGIDGRYRVSAPPPTPDRIQLGVSLTTDDGSRFDASLVGRPAPPPAVVWTGLRDAWLIRLHGIVLWLRRLPVQPRPVHDPEGAR